MPLFPKSTFGVVLGCFVSYYELSVNTLPKILQKPQGKKIKFFADISWKKDWHKTNLDPCVLGLPPSLQPVLSVKSQWSLHCTRGSRTTIYRLLIEMVFSGLNITNGENHHIYKGGVDQSTIVVLQWLVSQPSLLVSIIIKVCLSGPYCFFWVLVSVIILCRFSNPSVLKTHG